MKELKNMEPTCAKNDISKIEQVMADAENLANMVNELVYLISGDETTFPSIPQPETEPKGIIPMLAYEAERVHDCVLNGVAKINILNKYLGVKQA